MSTPTTETPTTQTQPTPATPTPVEVPEEKADDIELKAQVVVDKATEEVAKASKKRKAKKAATKKVAKKAVKAAAPKAKAKKEAKAKPTSGQSGPVIEDLTAETLNANETKVMKLAVKGDGTKTIVDMSKAFPNISKKKANSWTRNSLRRLVRGGFLAKVERGEYKATAKGRRRMAA